MEDKLDFRVFSLYSKLLLASIATTSIYFHLKIANPILTSTLFFAVAISSLCAMISLIFQLMKQAAISFYLRITYLVLLLFYLFVAVQYFLLQLQSKNTHVSWQVDWRHALAQAYSLSRFPDATDNLAYSGFRINYHALASVIAGHITSFTGISPIPILFLFIPILSLTSILAFSLRFASYMGLAVNQIFLVSIVALSVPITQIKYFSKGEVQTMLTNVALDNEVMINAFLALSMSAAVLFLCIDSQNAHFLAAAISMSLIGLSAAKPQYIPVLLLSIFFLKFLGNTRSKRLALNFDALPALTLLFSFVISLFLAFRDKSTGKLIVEMSPEALISYFNRGVILPALTLFGFSCFLILLLFWNRFPRSWIRILFPISAYFVLRLFSGFLQFRSDIESMPSPNIIGNVVDTGVDLDTEQGFALLHLVLLVYYTTLFLTRFGRIQAVTFCLIVSICIVNTWKFEQYRQQFLYPLSKGFEAIDNSDLDKILKPLDSRAFILVNDLVDPAMNFAHPGRGDYLIINNRVRFFVANLWPEWQAQDASQRIDILQRFFGTNLSEFHKSLIREWGITHILINFRCTPPWLQNIEFIARNSSFGLIDSRVLIELDESSFDGIVNGRFVSQSRNFGLAKCL